MDARTDWKHARPEVGEFIEVNHPACSTFGCVMDVRDWDDDGGILVYLQEDPEQETRFRRFYLEAGEWEVQP